MNAQSSLMGAYDHEVILSRKSVPGSVLGSKGSQSVPIYYDHIRKRFYMSLKGEDREYYERLKRSPREDLIGSSAGPEFYEFERGIPDDIRYFTGDLNNIPGVRGDLFSLARSGREYWRFLYMDENSDDVSDFILGAISERLEKAPSSGLMVEYIGKPHDIHWYLSRYVYGRRVVKVTIDEELYSEYLQKAPHYSRPFHYDLKVLDYGDGIIRTVRFTEGITEKGGIINEQSIIRNGDISVIEDERTGVVTSAYFDFARRRFLPILDFYCDFDGKDSTTTIILDHSSLSNLIMRIKEANDRYSGQVKLTIEEVEEFYKPEGKA